MMRSSFTRGASTVRVPAPTVTRLACARPVRTPSACTSRPLALRCRSVYATTSASSASASIRCAPSRASRSSADSSFVFPRPDSFSVTLSIGVPFPALAGAVVVGCFQLGKVRHLRQLMAIHNFRSYLGVSELLGCSTAHVYGLCERSELPHYRDLQNAIRFDCRVLGRALNLTSGMPAGRKLHDA